MGMVLGPINPDGVAATEFVITRQHLLQVYLSPHPYNVTFTKIAYILLTLTANQGYEVQCDIS